MVLFADMRNATAKSITQRASRGRIAEQPSEAVGECRQFGSNRLGVDDIHLELMLALVEFGSTRRCCSALQDIRRTVIQVFSEGATNAA